MGHNEIQIVSPANTSGSRTDLCWRFVLTGGTITACEGGNALVDYCKDYVPSGHRAIPAIVNPGGGKSQW